MFARINAARVIGASVLLTSIATSMGAQNVQQAGSTKTAAGATPPQTVPVLLRVKAVDEATAAIGRRIHVEVDGLKDAVERDKLDPRKFVLYLNGHALWNVRGEPVNLHRNKLEFLLERADTSAAAWVALLGQPKSLQLPNIRVGVGYDSRPELQSVDDVNPPTVALRVLSRGRLVWGVIFLLGVLGLFLGLAVRSTILRDSTPPNPPAGTKRPFSLARLQMGIWFFLVLGAFGFLWVITGSADTLNAQALTLMGIGTGTALGAAAVDAAKRQSAVDALASLEPEKGATQADIEQSRLRLSALAALAAPTAEEREERQQVAKLLGERQAELAQIEKKIVEAKATDSKPLSEGFFKDVLTDTNGVSFHRFQILIWTVVLGAIFVVGVYERLAMPEFNPSLLALMGISAGTYIGFKIPERQG